MQRPVAAVDPPAVEKYELAFLEAKGLEVVLGWLMRGYEIRIAETATAMMTSATMATWLDDIGNRYPLWTLVAGRCGFS